MQRAGLALAIAPVAVKVTELGVKIVQAALSVKHFKEICRELSNDCVHVLSLIRKYEGKNIELETTQRITECFQQCYAFMTECCVEWGVLQTSFEVMFRRRHDHLKEELKRVIDILTMEVVVSMYYHLLNLPSSRWFRVIMSRISPYRMNCSPNKSSRARKTRFSNMT